MTRRFRFHTLNLSGDSGATTKASDWLRELGRCHGLTEERLFHLDLCAAELMANTAEHSYRGAVGEVALELFMDRDAATLTVVDSGPPFDPTTMALPVQPRSLDEAPVGGLGLKLVRRFADGVSYERVDSRNRVTVRFGTRALLLRHRDRRREPPQGFPLARADGSQAEHDERHAEDRRALGIVTGTPLFRNVPTHLVDGILAHCELRDFATGDVLFAAGEQHRCVLVAIEGDLEVHLDAPDSHQFVRLACGESVGELSVVDGKPNSAWVVGGGAGRVLVIPEPVFLGSVLRVPSVVRNLIVVLSERMRNSNQQIVARLRATLELEALQRELDVARQIQFSMLPHAPLFPIDSGVVACGFMRAARQVGGDFYDAFPLADGRLFVAIGDVCGKGTPAALFMVRALTLLRSEALRPDKSAPRHLARLLERCNNLLSTSNDAQQYVTLFCAIIDAPRGRLDFVNAGHNAPLLRLPAAPPVFVELPRNPFAGLVPGLKFKVGEIEFPPGSLMLFYTDGVNEAEAGGDVFFGDDALRNLLAGETVPDADACVERVIAAVDAFAAGHPQSDDITLLAVRRP